MSDTNFADLLVHLDLVVLRHDGGSAFERTGKTPPWWYRLAATAPDVSLLQRFPFLESFWTGAQEQLDTPDGSVVRSSAWFETDSSGASYKLRATAIRQDATQYLVIEGRRVTTGEEHGRMEPPLPDYSFVATDEDSGDQSATAAGTDDASGGADRPLRILVTEDNPNNQRLVVLLLKDRGHSVHVANNGEEAIEAFQTERFDAILMDCQMPKVDGFEATETIRRMESKRGGHVPIIALTAFAMVGDRERCLDAGMDEYIAKPVQHTKLFEIVERLGRAAA